MKKITAILLVSASIFAFSCRVDDTSDTGPSLIPNSEGKVDDNTSTNLHHDTLGLHKDSLHMDNDAHPDAHDSENH